MRKQGCKQPFNIWGSAWLSLGHTALKVISNSITPGYCRVFLNSVKNARITSHMKKYSPKVKDGMYKRDISEHSLLKLKQL